MTLTSEVLEYIANYPYSRIEQLEVYFDEFTKFQLLSAVRRLNKRGKIEFKTSDMIIKTTGADMLESGWCITKETIGENKK